jgi:hopanoid biosynthesis associated RND transporter like protein HpnN
MTKDWTQAADLTDDDTGSTSKAASPRSWLERPLLLLTRPALQLPRATLLVAVGLAIFCTIYASRNLGYRSSRLDLLNPKSPYNRLWIQYINEFGDEDDAVIVVEGAGREEVVPVLDELSASLARNKRLFHSILKDVDRTTVISKCLHYRSVGELQNIDHFVSEYSPIVAGEWARLRVGSMVGEMSQLLSQPLAGAQSAVAQMGIAQLDHVVLSLLAQFATTPAYQSVWPDMQGMQSALSALGKEYIIYNQGKVGLIVLRIAVANTELARGNEAITALRELIADAAAQHPGVHIGLTGLPILENDEMSSSQLSMTWGGVVSFIGVIIVVVAGFGGVRHALMANLVLLIGASWAFGYATLVVGHLNLLSITFTATLIGVGIDYGTYYVSRYIQLRREGTECEAALRKTTRVAGPAIITGAMTTVVAFFATGAASFTGIAELGIIAGGGILLCALAQLFVLPALVRVVDESSLGKRFPKPVPIHSAIALLMKAPRLIMAVGVAITLLAAIGLKNMWFDYNLLNLQPENLESVALEHKLLTECDQSMWYAISIADTREQLLTRKKQFERLASVERTDEIAHLLVGDDEPKRPIIVDIGNQLKTLPERPPLIAIDKLEDLGLALAQAQDVVSRNPAGTECARHLEMLREAMRRFTVAECFAKISQFQQQMAGELLSHMYTLRSISNPDPPQLSDLPASLVNRYVGHTGKHLLKIYGKGDIHNMDALQRFVHDVRAVDPQATGNPLQTYECSLEMMRSYKNASILSLVIILGVLYFDFRNLKHCALAAFPQFMGIAVTFGLLGYLNVPLNPANLMAVPMILGIGVDYSVYVVHEYLEQKGRYRMSPGTAIAVTVDSLTTLIGYGSLLIASHRGLQSLGKVLTLAVAFCTFMSIIVLPAFLTWATRKRPLIPWVGDAVESYDHDGNLPTPSDEEPDVLPSRRAA